MELPELTGEKVARIASLVGIGRKSGDTVVGLSAVRRTRDLGFVFMDAQVSQNTARELAGLRQRGVRVFRAASLLPMTQVFGREEVLVIGIRRGGLTQGIAGRLEEGEEEGEVA